MAANRPNRGSAARSARRARQRSLSTDSYKLLTPAEECGLVSRLCKLRHEILRTLKPLLDRTPAETRRDHFDQILGYFRAGNDLPKRIAQRVEKPLREYREIKHVLVLANLPWITRVARAHRRGAIAHEDLFQEGVCGLLKAIDRFEAGRGLRLMTYATWYIREAMQQVRARQSHLVALSAHDQALLSQLEAERVVFQHRHHRPPSTGELESAVATKSRSVGRLQTATRPPVSLERAGTDGSLPVAVQDPVHEIDRLEEVHIIIRRLLSALPARERVIVTRRFGLEGEHPTSLEALGDCFKVSKERIRQLQRQAIRRMQEFAVSARGAESSPVSLTAGATK